MYNRHAQQDLKDKSMLMYFKVKHLNSCMHLLYMI